ncbi:uncharacterized protein [Periplaneta americana]|uniref:uncharacterized protein isoform X1 n=1 Tax=Periplaneta americana TaxID=6978 RepID=UPI0037E80022
MCRGIMGFFQAHFQAVLNWFRRKLWINDDRPSFLRRLWTHIAIPYPVGMQKSEKISDFQRRLVEGLLALPPQEQFEAMFEIHTLLYKARIKSRQMNISRCAPAEPRRT